MRGRLLLSLVALAAVAAFATTATAASPTSTVVVPRGEPVQIAFTAITLEGDELAAFTDSFRKAIRLAVALNPSIRGFSVQVNTVETSCGGDNTAAANTIVGNGQNVGVIGHLCSAGSVSALPVYEAAGVVTISGSATLDSLPELGPTVFNRLHVRDGDNAVEWYAQVTSSPVNRAWQKIYRFIYGEDPTTLADLYFDATRLLLARIEETAKVVQRRLIIDRAALAAAVRNTQRFFGVTCPITIDPATGNRVNDPASISACTRP